jgi:hypothetical protein
MGVTMNKETPMCKHHDLFLAHREKTGCKQYVFYSFTDLYNYFNKACYKGETIYYSAHQWIKDGKYSRPYLEDCLYFNN